MALVVSLIETVWWTLEPSERNGTVFPVLPANPIEKVVEVPGAGPALALMAVSVDELIVSAPIV